MSEYTIEVDRQSLLNVVRKIDFDAPISTHNFTTSFDELRGAFDEGEISSGQAIPTVNSHKALKEALEGLLADYIYLASAHAVHPFDPERDDENVTASQAALKLSNNPKGEE